MLSLSASREAPSYRPTLLRTLARWVRWRLPRRISSHRILSGQLKGKRIVTSWRDYPAAIAGITEPLLLDWFAKNVKVNETWLDVGAHYGYTAISLAGLVGKGGRVFAFEPMTSTVGCLARTRFINNLDCLTILPMAIGAVDDLQLQQLATVRGMVDSTLGPDKLSVGGDWSEMFMVARLDWLWPRISGIDPKIDGVKIDVQGMEMHVLKGMKELLGTLKPRLVLELHRGVDRKEILDLLSGVGYSTNAIPIEPVQDEKDPLFLDDRSYAFSPLR